MERKIFLISRDANIGAALEAKLSLNGFWVKASDVFEPVEIKRQLTRIWPDFLILNQSWPDFLGHDLLYNLKAEPDLNLVIFVYAETDDEADDKEEREKAANYGVNYYFSKNELNIDEFINKIKRIADNLRKI